MTQSELIEQRIQQFSCSSFYPHPVEVITTIETHISIVFLTGQYAYKLKKPVNFGFLDFSSLENRKKYTRLEVKLNQRTAPELYIASIPVYADSEHQLSLEENGSNPVEYLVKMHQFDPNQVLSRVLKHQTLNDDQITTLVNNICHLHDSAETCDADQRFGSFEDVVKPMEDNFPSLLQTFTEHEEQYKLKQLKNWTDHTHNQLKSSIESRKNLGHIKACHGDMHLDNITLIDDKPILFDGIEFNDQFRWIDKVSDLAFLIIDCDHRQQLFLSRKIIQQYFQITGDYDGLKVFRFYRVYRTMVRAKITALRAVQLEDETQKKQTLAVAKSYILQAENYAYQATPPTLILMQGVSGSGKSHYAHQLLQVMDAHILSSDIERKRLFGIQPTQRVSENEKTKLYSPQMNQKTYQHLLRQAEQILNQGYNVIVDATFLKPEHRTPFEALATHLNLPFKQFIVEVNEAKIPQIEANIVMRQTANLSASDADTSILHRQLKNNTPPIQNERTWTIKAGSSLDLEAISDFISQT